MTRTVDVDGTRLPRWVAGFSSRHGQATAVPTGTGLALSAPDGATADIAVPFPPFAPAVADPADPVDPDDPAALDALVAAAAAHACAERAVAVLLIRRGGYACALVRGSTVLASKVGTRYVQSRTAAGGWSQQRFARRRENQAHELEKAVVGVAERVLLSGPAAPQWLVTGGDKPLLDAVLADHRLSRLAVLPRGGHLAIGDPDGKLVASLPTLLQKASIRVSDPEPAG